MTFSHFLQASIADLAAGNYVYPDTGTKGMMGFANKGCTTGGTGGPVFKINTLQELQKQVADVKPRILVLVKNITVSEKTEIRVGANKTIIGSWKGNVLDNVYLITRPRSRNVIFQNLVFKHSTKNVDNGDTQLIIQNGERYWIDHCTFDGRKVDYDDLGKLLKIAEKVDFVTISNSKFMNHRYGLIFGHPHSDESVVGIYNNYPRVTVMYNYFDNLYVRGPGLMRFGKYHLFNNYITNYHLGLTIHFFSKIYSENNYYTESSKKDHVLDDKGNGFFKDIGSKNMQKTQVSPKLTAWKPSTDYSYKAESAEYARDFCLKYSGAQTNKLVFGG